MTTKLKHDLIILALLAFAIGCFSAVATHAMAGPLLLLVIFVLMVVLVVRFIGMVRDIR